MRSLLLVPLIVLWGYGCLVIMGPLCGYAQTKPDPPPKPAAPIVLTEVESLKLQLAKAHEEVARLRASNAQLSAQIIQLMQERGQAELRSAEQEKMDLEKGFRTSHSVPEGMVLDEDKREFVPRPAPPRKSP